MNVNSKTKSEIMSAEKSIMQQRVISGKSIKLAPEERLQIVNECQIKRDIHENANLGMYEKVYPFENMGDDFEKYMVYAAKLYEDSTGTSNFFIKSRF